MGTFLVAVAGAFASPLASFGSPFMTSMSIEDWLGAQMGLALPVVAAGLLVRRRVAFARVYFCYLIISCAFIDIRWIWPDLTADYSFYSAKETVLFVLKILVAVEIWQRSFAVFPPARVRVGSLLLVPLACTAVAVRMVPPLDYPYYMLVGIIHPRQQAGTLAVYAVIVAGAWWYRVPLHPLHRAILVGFTAFLSVSVLCHSVVGSRAGGEWVFRVADVAQMSAYALTLMWWAWAAWRPARAPGVLVARLQPWAHSW